MKENLIIPNHIGIIMDGNGRWAQERGKIRSAGHRAGVDTFKRLMKYMSKVGVKYVSLFVFSTENFKREKQEVDFLMDLFVKMFKDEFNEIMEANARVVFSGRGEPLPKKVLEAMRDAEEKSKSNTGPVLNICINYGGQYEIVDTMKKVCELYKDNKISLDDITREFIQESLYQNLPPLDFVIRTSGEQRISNFMLYQSSYAEYYFPQTYFPDFTEDEFDKAIIEFNKRNRRFGGIKK